MDKININRVIVANLGCGNNFSRYGFQNACKYSSLQVFNEHVAAISKQKDWQMYFPMEAVIKFQNPDGTLQRIEFIRINRPIEITL